MNICRLLFFTLVSFTLFLYNIEPTCSDSENSITNMDIQKIIASAETGASLIKSGKGTLTIETISDTTNCKICDKKNQPSTGPGTLTVYLPWLKRTDIYAFDGERIFQEQHYAIPPIYLYTIHQITAFNGECIKQLILDKNIATKEDIQQAQIYPPDEKWIFAAKTISPHYNSLNIMGNPVPDILKGEGKFLGRPITKVKIEGEETVDSEQCLKISGTIADSDTVFQAWLMKDHYYMTKKIDITSSHSRDVFETTFETTRESIFFPKKRIWKNYCCDLITGMWILRHTTMVTINDDYAVNIPLPDDQFDITFPPGVKVYDNFHSKTK